MSIKGIAGMGIAAAGTVYAMGKLSGMDSDDIREKGQAAVSKLQEWGGKLSDSEIADDIREKISGVPYIGRILSFTGTAAEKGVSGFGKFVDAIADAKERSEKDGSDFAANMADSMAGSLKGAVASVGDYVAEKLGFGEQAKPGEPMFTRDEKEASSDGPEMECL